MERKRDGEWKVGQRERVRDLDRPYSGGWVPEEWSPVATSMPS